MKYVVMVGETTRVVEIGGADGVYRLTVGDEVWEVDARLTAAGIYSLIVDGASWVADVVDRGGVCQVDVGGEVYDITVEEQTRHIIRTRGGATVGHRNQALTAPLPGKVSRVAVAVGDTVRAGDTLLVIEAMKMENEFKASAAGTVMEVRVQPGQAVNAGDVLMVME